MLPTPGCEPSCPSDRPSDHQKLHPCAFLSRSLTPAESTHVDSPVTWELSALSRQFTDGSSGRPWTGTPGTLLRPAPPAFSIRTPISPRRGSFNLCPSHIASGPTSPWTFLLACLSPTATRSSSPWSTSLARWPTSSLSPSFPPPRRLPSWKNHVFRIHGLPIDLVSDRGLQFSSIFGGVQRPVGKSQLGNGDCAPLHGHALPFFLVMGVIPTRPGP